MLIGARAMACSNREDADVATVVACDRNLALDKTWVGAGGEADCGDGGEWRRKKQCGFGVCRHGEKERMGVGSV